MADDMVKLMLEGTVVEVRLDRKATIISLLIALGVRRAGQKNMGGESETAWRAMDAVGGDPFDVAEAQRQ